MDKDVRQSLRKLIDEHGQSICDDPARCLALMKDCFGSNKREINLLVSALREGAVKDLIIPPAGTTLRMLISHLTKRLEDNLGFSTENARWAVESWALALGKTIALPHEPPLPLITTGPEATVDATKPPPPARGSLNFWMVIVEGSRKTSFKHWDKANAIQEAERLSRLRDVMGKKQVILLEAVGACTASSSGVVWQML